MERRASRGIAARTALVVLGTGAALLAAELALRVAPGPRSAAGLRDLHEARPDRPWLFGLRPGAESRTADVAYAINADGFRDRLYARPKPDGVYRIAVLGDSLSFGFGVALEETFPKQLEETLSPRLRAEVLNLGVGGYNPYTEAQLFADRAAAYEPDLVLVQFCINDLNDPTLHFDAQTRANLGALPAAAFPDPAKRLPPPSPLEVALASCPARLCGLLLQGLHSRTPAEARATFAPRSALPPGPERRWLRDQYKHIAREAQALGARFAVVVFPHRPQIRGRASDRIQRDLVALGREGGWPTLDLLPAFRAAAAEGEEPLFLDLWHPTAAGHRVAAAAIAEQLLARGLVPGRATRGPAPP